MKKSKLIKKIKNKKRFHVISSLLSVGLVGAGASCVTTTAISNANTKKLKKDKYDSSASNRDTVHSASLSPNEITDRHLNSIKQAVISKYASSLNYYNTNVGDRTHQINIDKQVSAMKYDFDNFKPAPEVEKASELQNVSYNQMCYSHIKTVSQKLGVEVADTFQIKNNTAKEARSSIFQHYLQNGNNKEDATAKTDKAIANIIDVANTSAQYQDTTEQFSLRLAESYDVNGDNKNALQEALNYLQTNLSKTLCVKEDTSLFTNLMKDYSGSGVYDVGSEINPNDFAKLFTFDYDISMGADLSDYAYDTTNIPPVQGDYSDRVLTQTKDFSTFDGPSCTLGVGEFYTGYVAHIKILSKDVYNDSHKGKITLQFGVSSTTDQTKILWSDVNYNPYVKKAGINTDGLMRITMVPNIEQIKYISQHNYYKDIPPITFNAKPDEKGVYFGSDMDNRCYIEDIMGLYKNNSGDTDGRYHLDKNPIYLASNNAQGKWIVGIPKPSYIKDFSFDKVNVLNSLHSNQSLMLKVSNIDSSDVNEPILTINWCLMDTAGQGGVDVLDIPFLNTLTNEKLSTIKVGYKLNPVDSYLFNYSEQIICLFQSVGTIADMIENSYDSIQALSYTEIAFEAANVVISAIAVIMLVVLWIFNQPGAILSSVAIGFLATYIALELYSIAENAKDIETMNKLKKDYDNNDFLMFLRATSHHISHTNWLSILESPTKTFGSKRLAAINLSAYLSTTISSNLIKIFENLLKDLIDFSDYDAPSGTDPTSAVQNVISYLTKGVLFGFELYKFGSDYSDEIKQILAQIIKDMNMLLIPAVETIKSMCWKYLTNSLITLVSAVATRYCGNWLAKKIASKFVDNAIETVTETSTATSSAAAAPFNPSLIGVVVSMGTWTSVCEVVIVSIETFIAGTFCYDLYEYVN